MAWGACHRQETRREIARALDLYDCVRHGGRFTTMLEQLWVLDPDPLGEFLGFRASLRAEIEQHVYRNPDWSTEDLFEALGAFDASDRRFGLLLERLASADVLLDVEAQHKVVDSVNSALQRAGLELRETGDDGGCPVFGIVSTGAVRGRPKNLIFASQAKPDLRFRDAIDNDVEIMSHEDDVLVYDRAIASDGLRWRDLQDWWAQTRDVTGDPTATLYKRLGECLPANSPPQRNLFTLYHSLFRQDVPDLPALLPEVWLHWDPKAARERGKDALIRFRMDFLMLLPHGRRIVLEIDGKHHYANGDRADPAKYAETMRADRELKLSGYEVFRFGAVDLLSREQATETVKAFFLDLFRTCDLPVGLPA